MYITVGEELVTTGGGKTIQCSSQLMENLGLMSTFGRTDPTVAAC